MAKLNISGLRADFEGALGAKLSARLELPAGPIRAYAIFAHCFTCSKNVKAATTVAQTLATRGVAVLRFDFTGLGSSEGDFANTDFSSNVGDLVAAAGWLRDNYQAPALLIGHSLGGAAVIVAANQIPEVKAVATIGAPADAEHVLHNFHADIGRIEQDGVADVTLAGRPFTIRKEFLDDVRAQSVRDHAAKLRRALLVMHAPTDATVGVENATGIFGAAKHPKSFVSLDGADHLLTNKLDAQFAGTVMAAWAARYISTDNDVVAGDAASDAVTVTESGLGKFQQTVEVGPHHLLADEPASVGGDGTGLTPYDYVAAGLGACTSMTLRMYADRKGIDLGRIRVSVDHGKVHAQDCSDCAEGLTGQIDRFERKIAIEGDLSEEMQQKVLEIADKCPVHRTLERANAIVTKLQS